MGQRRLLSATEVGVEGSFAGVLMARQLGDRRVLWVLGRPKPVELTVGLQKVAGQRFEYSTGESRIYARNRRGPALLFGNVLASRSRDGYATRRLTWLSTTAKPTVRWR